MRQFQGTETKGPKSLILSKTKFAPYKIKAACFGSS